VAVILSDKMDGLLNLENEENKILRNLGDYPATDMASYRNRTELRAIPLR